MPEILDQPIAYCPNPRRRAWTVFGYSVVTTLVIYAGLMVIFLFIALLGSLVR